MITDLELVDISKDLFVGTGIGNKRKVIIAGSDFVSAFSKIDSDKFRLKDTVDIWKLKFKSWETDFGEVLMIHSELFDLFGMSDCGFALEVVEEVQPSEEMLEIPGMAEELRRPMMLLVRAKKHASK